MSHVLLTLGVFMVSYVVRMSLRTYLFAVALLCAIRPLPGQDQVDPESRRILQSSVDFLASLTRFEVGVDEAYEVDQEGEQVKLSLVRNFKVQRPDHIFSNVRGAGAERSFWFDGKSLILLLREENVYTEDKAPASLGALVDYLEEQYDLSNPLGTLLLGEGKSLIGRLISASYGGLETVQNIGCHRLDLGFRGFE